jgi:UDP-glucose 4-epimerase
VKVLVTGGAGFIGSHLCEGLVDCGERVVALDDLSTGRRANLRALDGHPRFRLVQGSILDEALVEALMAEADLCFHLAAAVGVRTILERPLESLRTNLRGTELVLEAASRDRVPMVVASTSEVYGKNDAGPIAEDADRVLGSSRVARWHYATAKAADEALALAYAEGAGLSVLVVRLFNTVGPRQRGRYGMVLPRLVRQALSSQPLTVYGDGKQTRCFTYVRDTVRCLLALADIRPRLRRHATARPGRLQAPRHYRLRPRHSARRDSSSRADGEPHRRGGGLDRKSMTRGRRNRPTASGRNRTC